MIRASVTRIDPIQGLRAVAALLVVVDHSMSMMIENGTISGVEMSFAWMFGGIGVKIFFLISGFIMTTTMHGEFAKPRASSDFITKRFLRIVPLYWLATTLFAAKLAFQGSFPGFLPLTLSFLFLPHANHVGEMQPVYGLGWTLNYEMFFYLFFAIAIMFPVIPGLLGLVSTLTLLVIAVKFGFSTGFPSSIAPMINFWGDPIILFFVGGILIGALRIGLIRSDRLFRMGIYGALTAALICILAYVTFAFIGFGADPNSRWEIAVCLASVIACGLVADSARDERYRSAIRSLGDASYSIYLTHGFLIGTSARLWFRFFGSHGAPMFVAFMLIVSSFVGLLTYRFVEKPLLKALRSASNSGK